MKRKHPKKRKRSYRDRVFLAVLNYLWGGKHKPHALKLKEPWLGDMLIDPVPWEVDAGVYKEMSHLEMILPDHPQIIKRLPTECFRHRYRDVRFLVVPIQTENERVFRDIRHEPWEWIMPLTREWCSKLAQQIYEYESAKFQKREPISTSPEANAK